MIRNLKVVLAAALALGAIGAVGGSAAQAANFHCNATVPCRGTLKPDGTTTTAHHVFVIETANTSNSASFTCDDLKGEASIPAATVTEVTFENLNYQASTPCKVNGSPGVTIDMNGCKLKFTNTGTVSVTGCTNVGKSIEITITNGCVFTIPESSVQNLTGVAYHTSGTAPSRELTVEINHVTIQGITSNVACETLIGTGHTTGLIGTYTTGNTLVTGETQSGVMTEAWFE